MSASGVAEDLKACGFVKGEYADDAYKREVRAILEAKRQPTVHIDSVMRELDRYPAPRQYEFVRAVQPGESPQGHPDKVWIPPTGEPGFEMGCRSGELYCQNDEKPPHRVVLTKGIWMARTETTVADYLRVTQGKVAPPPAPDFNKDWAKRDHPIVNVTWDEAVGYCALVSGRLPTEAEWEWAARANAGAPAKLGDFAWYDANSGGMTHPVGEKLPNAWNLRDMLGNAWEWASDWYDGKFYSVTGNGRDPRGPAGGQFRVVRGGSWNDDAEFARASYRLVWRPGLRLNYQGFRCVWDRIP